MKRWFAALVLLTTTMAGAQISPQFFGLHIQQPASPWPNSLGIQFSTWRSEGSGIKWSDINRAPGVYYWTALDQWLAANRQSGEYVLFDIYYTPAWASSCPTCVCAPYFALGGCYPPSDLSPDGSGTDQYLKDFVTALLQHVGPGEFKYIEVWNEPNVNTEYAGTVAQLVRMTSDIRAIANGYDPNIQIVSPAETGDGSNLSQMRYLASYLAAGGGQYVDIIALHGYVANPEDIIARINSTLSVMSLYGQSGKPVFVTEGSWWSPIPPYPSSQKPGFTFRHYLSMLSTPVQRFYLYAYDNDTYGTLWNPHSKQLTQTGTAYELFYGWLVGTTMTHACQAQPAANTVWSCLFTKPGGYQAAAVWSTSLPIGQTINVTAPPQFVRYKDVYGNEYTIVNHQIPIGFNPIWLESQATSRTQ